MNGKVIVNLDDIEFLHLYEQGFNHDEAYIAGTRKGLETLRDAITDALSRLDGVSAAIGMASDGEGYWVHVHAIPLGEFHSLTPPYDVDMEDNTMHPEHLPMTRQRHGGGKHG